jgi:hypothetical protein
MTSPHSAPLSPVCLEHDPWGQLLMETDDGRRFSGVVPVRAFPVSDPDHWISICDAHGAEILRIDDIGDMPPGVRAMLEHELSQREFVPVIRKILSATQHEPSEWLVETDRGRTTFQLNSEDDVRRIEPDQASIVDAHGIRYLVTSVRGLDGGSRRILEYFL